MGQLFTSSTSGDRFQVKRLVVRPQGRLSLQSHSHRWEHWTVVSGEATVTVGEGGQDDDPRTVDRHANSAIVTGWRISAAPRWK